MATIDQVCQFVDGQQAPSSCPGGRHLFVEGTVIHDRFKVLQCLNRGMHSTVWLVRDLDLNELYALKVLNMGTHNNELAVHRHLFNRGVNHESVIQLVTNFELPCNGQVHDCLVLPAIGPNLDQLDQSALPTWVLARAAKALTSGVAFLHKEGLCHTDLSAHSILFEIPGMRNWTDEQVALYCHDGEDNPSVDKYTCSDSSYGVDRGPGFRQPMPFDRVPPSFYSGNIFICGFTQCFNVQIPPQSPPDGLIPYFPPERLVALRTASIPTDLWATGCLLLEIMGTHVAFPLPFRRSDLLMLSILNSVGPFSENLVRQSLERDDNTFESMRDVQWGIAPWDNTQTRRRKVRKLIERRCPRLSQHEIDLFRPVIGSLLAMDPNRRVPTAVILMLPWYRYHRNLRRALGFED